MLDINLPDISGLQLQKRIAAERAEMPIIFINGYGDIPATVRAMRAGAVEFLKKPFGALSLLEAINGAIRCSFNVIKRVGEVQSILGHYASLAPQQHQFMALVLSERMNKQIADDLDTTEITVKERRGKVMQKMRARSVADLGRMSEKLCAHSGHDAASSRRA